MSTGEHSPSTIVYSNEATTIAAICACIFIVVGTIGNVLTIAALYRNNRIRQHATTVFVLSLCVSDLIFCLVNLPLTANRYINKAWTAGDTLCKIFPILFYSNVAISLLSMVAITINRYISISNYSLYLKIYKPNFIYGQLIFIWTVAFAIMIPPIFGQWGQLGLDIKTFSCTILKKDGKSMKTFLFLIGFILPCTVIVCCYSCIYWTVRKQSRKLSRYKQKSVKDDPTRSPVQSPNTDDKRLTVMILTIFICFILCFGPLMIVNVADDENKYPWLHIFASVLAWASSCINPFVYAVSNRTYRMAYVEIFQKCGLVSNSRITTIDSQLDRRQRQCNFDGKSLASISGLE